MKLNKSMNSYDDNIIGTFSKTHNRLYVIHLKKNTLSFADYYDEFCLVSIPILSLKVILSKINQNIPLRLKTSNKERN